MNQEPIIPLFPGDETPIPYLLDALCIGLDALGLKDHAREIKRAYFGGLKLQLLRAAVSAAIHDVEVSGKALAAADASKSWQELVACVLSQLKTVRRRIR